MYAEELKKAVQHDFKPNIVKEWAYHENMRAKSPREEPHFQLKACWADAGEPHYVLGISPWISTWISQSNI